MGWKLERNYPNSDSKISNFRIIFFISNSENCDSIFFKDRNWNIKKILISHPIFISKI